MDAITISQNMDQGPNSNTNYEFTNYNTMDEGLNMKMNMSVDHELNETFLLLDSVDNSDKEFLEDTEYYISTAVIPGLAIFGVIGNLLNLAILSSR